MPVTGTNIGHPKWSLSEDSTLVLADDLDELISGGSCREVCRGSQAQLRYIRTRVRADASSAIGGILTNKSGRRPLNHQLRCPHVHSPDTHVLLARHTNHSSLSQRCQNGEARLCGRLAALRIWVELIVTGCGCGAEHASVQFLHSGCDSQVWSGYESASDT